MNLYEEELYTEDLINYLKNIICNISTKIEDIYHIDTTYFCNNLTNMGDFMFANDTSDICRPFEYKLSNDKLIGISSNNVVNLDLTQRHLNIYKNEVPIGSKVSIIKEGIATFKIPTINIDKNTIYLSSTNNLTCEPTNIQLGNIMSYLINTNGNMLLKLNLSIKNFN